MAEFLALLALPAMQYLLVAVAGTSVAVDVWPKVKGLDFSKLKFWGKGGTAVPAEEFVSHKDCLLDLRHRVSEMTSANERAESLLLCDEVDKLYAKLYGGEAA